MTPDPNMPAFLKRTPNNKLPGFTKPLVYSYTLLKTADNCMYKAYRQYVKKDIAYVETPEMKWGNEVHSAMEYRMGGKPLPANMLQWEPIAATYAAHKPQAEKKVGVTRDGKPSDFFGQNVFLRGKIDVTIINGTSAFLPDWKTGSSKYEDPFELEIQAVLLKAANPYLVKIAGHYVYLKENRAGQIHDLSDVNSTWAHVHNKVEQIEDAMRSDEWPKNKNPLCGYCPVKDCEFCFDARAK